MISGEQCGHDDCCKECKWYKPETKSNGLCMNTNHEFNVFNEGTGQFNYIATMMFNVCELFEEKL